MFTFIINILILLLNLFSTLFIFGFTGSLLLCRGFLWLSLSGGYALVAVHGLLTGVASLVEEPGLYSNAGLGSGGVWA